METTTSGLFAISLGQNSELHISHGTCIGGGVHNEPINFMITNIF